MSATSRCSTVLEGKEVAAAAGLALSLGELIRSGVRLSKCTHLPNGIGRLELSLHADVLWYSHRRIMWLFG